MKTKLSIMLTALLMLICVSATAQSGSALNGITGKSAVNNVGSVASSVMSGSYQSTSDLNGDNKVNAVDIVQFVNMTPVNIKIKNATSAAISLSPRIRFVLKNKSTDAAWLGTPGSVVTINSNETKEYNNVLISNSKVLRGQNFASSSELDGLSSNVVLYDTPANDWNSTTIVPGMMDSSVKFEAGGNYEIVIGANSSASEPVNPQPATQNVTTTVTVKNNSGSTKTFDGKICFVTYGSHPTENYTGHFTVVGTCSGNDFTIANGAEKVYTVTFAKDDNQTPTIALGMPFAGTGQLASYSANNGYYVNGVFTPCTNFSTSMTFTQGGQYTMTIPGSGSTVDPTPTTDNVTTTVTIKNNSGAAKTFDGKICFLTYGTYKGYTGYFTVIGTCSGSDFTIASGAQKVYTVTFAKDDDQTPTVALGMPFASAAQIASSSYSANNGYYVNNVFTPCTNISTSMTFTQGGQYTMTIPGSGTTVDPTPTTDNVTTTVTIKNNSGASKTFDGKICFLTYGTYNNYTGYFTVMGTCSGSDFTIASGAQKVYTVTFAKDNSQTPTVALGMPFASAAQIASSSYSANNGYYVNNVFTPCTNISTSMTFTQGGQYTMTIPGSGSTVDPTPTTQNVTTTVTIKNNSGAAKTFDGKICFLTYGTYNNYTGYFTVMGTCSGSDFTIASGAQKVYTVTFAKDNSQTPTVALGMPFASAAQIASSSYSANNGYYVNNVFTPCTNISTSMTFTQGGQYTMTIPGSGSTVDPTPTPPPTNGSVTTTVTIKNESGVAKTFTGRVCFITYGTYDGYTGYFRIKGTCASGSDLTIPAGGSRTYTITFAKDNNQTPSVANGMHFAGSTQRAQFQSNNGYYMADGGCYTCNDFSTNDTFRNGGQYTMVIPANTHEWSSTSTVTPVNPTPVNPTPTNGSVTTTVTIVNNSGAAKTFTGRVCFITYGTYDGYTGYFRIKGNCASGSNLTIPAGGSRTYTITFAKDANQTPSVANGMHFAGSAQRAQFQSNNGYYMADGGCYTCNDFSTNDTFRNGGQYTMVIPANTHEWSSSSSTPSTSGSSVTTTVTIVNNTREAKTIGGRVCFITYGTYSGYTGYFRIKGTCSGASLTIPAGGSRTYTVTFPKDNNQTPSVAVGMHFASQAQRNQFQSNNGYYMPNGACYTCTEFSTNDTFRNGGSYTMVIPANTHEWSSN